jgi:hypothetical protein
MQTNQLSDRLCKAFCASIDVRAVPSGFAISSAFEDESGDPITFYLNKSDDDQTFVVEDDGAFLAHLIAKDIAIDQGARGQLLDAILGRAGAYWDRETYEIRSSPFHDRDLTTRVIEFLSSLIRLRDLELLTRDVVRSTFRDDVLAAIYEKFSKVADISENASVLPEFSEFPADIIIKPHSVSGIPGALYLANTNEKLSEALLLLMETQKLAVSPVAVIAVIEDPALKAISTRKFQRAQNRSLPMPIFRGDENAAMTMIGRQLGLVA